MKPNSKAQNQIPVYSLDTFREFASDTPFIVEVFDRNRHYTVEYPHRHDFFYEILYIKAGKGTYLIDFTAYEIKPETVFLVAPGQIHDIQFSEDVYGYIFLFSEDCIEKDVQSYVEFIFDTWRFGDMMRLQPYASLEHDLNEAIKITNHSNLESRLIIQKILSLIILQLYGQMHKVLDVSQKKQNPERLITFFKRLVKKHLPGAKSVHEYAQMMHVTPSHLNETVKKSTGLTAGDLIRHALITEMKREVAYGNQSIQEISDAFGFPDSSYFARFFKKYTQCSPLEFRKKTIKNTEIILK